MSDEVASWAAGLDPSSAAVLDGVIERLAVLGNQLRMPHSRSLGGGLYELRFTMGRLNQRVTYVFEPERQVVTLTTFHKQRDNERRQVLRARRAQVARGQDRGRS